MVASATAMTRLVFLSASELAGGIRGGEFGAREVLEAHLSQIERYNGQLNAIVTLAVETARQRADAADAAAGRGDWWGPLHGVPVTIKDCFETAGLRTTSSFRPLANYVPARDATVVARLRQAGAIVLGKSNLPQLSFGLQTDSPLFGRANNPWNLALTPGGSTGGGAAAIAAGLTPLDIGGDLGGSIRIPAHFCGIFSLKPTEYRVSRAGIIGGRLQTAKPARNLGVAGPLARSAADLRLVLQAIEGADGREWTVPPATAPPDRHPKPLSACRIAWTDGFGGVPVDAETRRQLAELARKLASLGCLVERCNPPEFDVDAILETYGRLCAAEIFIGRARPTRWFYKALSFVPHPLLPDSRVVRGLFAGARQNLQDYVEALEVRDRLATRLQEFFARWDAWLCPVAPGPAFPHCHVNTFLGTSLPVDSAQLPYWVWGLTYVAPFNVTGNPTVTMPLGTTATGLPLGVQVVGPRWQDYALLDLVEQIERTCRPLRHPPGY